MSIKDSLNDIVSTISTTKQEEDPDLTMSIIEARKDLLELEGRSKFFELRDMWSFWIIGWISTFIFFHITITILVGVGKLDFQSHVWLLPSIIAENFCQIIGMGYIIVRFLYQPSK